jgi:hypothetical protein
MTCHAVLLLHSCCTADLVISFSCSLPCIACCHPLWGVHCPARSLALRFGPGCPRLRCKEAYLCPCFPCCLLLAAFRSGAVMGFLLAGFGLLNLYLGIMIFKAVRVGTTRCRGSSTAGACAGGAIGCMHVECDMGWRTAAAGGVPSGWALALSKAVQRWWSATRAVLQRVGSLG